MINICSCRSLLCFFHSVAAEPCFLFLSIQLNVLHEYVIISIYVFSFFADIPNPVFPVILPFPPLNCPTSDSMVPYL